MSITESSEQCEETDAPSVAAELGQLRRTMREQGDRIKGAQQAFTIFAVLAFVVAVASLTAIAIKLDGTTKVVTVTQPTPAAALPSGAGAAAAAPAGPARVGVQLKEFTVTPTARSAAAGKVRFTVRNAGTITHEFVVLRTDAPAAKLPMKNGRADESGNVGETGDIKAGATKAVALTLKAGHYALICNLPGHYKAGQYADFTVR